MSAQQRPRTATYVVVGTHPWSRQRFEEKLSRFPGQWVFVDRPQDLTPRRVDGLLPRYLFFLHWSWKIPAQVVRSYECVGFHMTNLPYGRGGSPLQHLILKGYRETMLSAFRMTSVLDAGPIYCKMPLSLRGTAEHIYRRASSLAARMIQRIISGSVKPVPQRGTVVRFKRRRPAESLIPALPMLGRLYDFIRMLDAADYPRAFLVHEGLRYEFSEAVLHPNSLEASVKITPMKPS